MIPVIVLVGRQNVGKSTLFNRFTKSQDALVANYPGLTRDRIYGEGTYDDKSFIVIDTGGINGDEQGVDAIFAQQVKQALQEADCVLFLVDGRSGMTASDETIAQQLRQLQKPIYLVLNKTDGIDPHVAQAEFFQLGLGEPVPIAATHGRGVKGLLERVLEPFPEQSTQAEEEQDGHIKFAIVGRPNVGKSTLVNRILGEERVVTLDQPGTTRDSIYIPFERRGKAYTIIDTAGVRRRAQVHETIEKFSVVKTLQAIKEANVVVAVLDARQGIAEQDLRLLGFVLESGRALVLALNKWDGIASEERDAVKRELDRRLGFVNYARLHVISALHGTGVGDLYASIEKAYASAMRDLPTSVLTKILEEALQAHTPPVVRGRRIKLRYAHAGGHNPPIIVIHGNQVGSLPASYKRYLANAYRKALALEGTPIRIELKSSENPFAGRRNKLTPRQERKRKRMKNFTKKKS